MPRDRKWQETVKQKSMFNTNNVWVSMSGIRRVVERGFKDMEVNVNSKTLRSGVNVLQLETGVAGPVKVFQGRYSIAQQKISIDFSVNLCFYSTTGCPTGQE